MVMIYERRVLRVKGGRYVRGDGNKEKFAKRYDGAFFFCPRAGNTAHVCVCLSYILILKRCPRAKVFLERRIRGGEEAECRAFVVAR